MWIIIVALLGVIFWQYIKAVNKEAEFLGQNSSLKLEVERKEKEIYNLNKEIHRLENPIDIYDD